MKRAFLLSLALFLLNVPAHACEVGHWVETVSDDGSIIKLEDGSIYEVTLDAATSALWLPLAEIVSCGDKLINTDDGETVDATQLR